LTKILKDISVSSLVTAIEVNLFEFFKLFERWPRAEVHDDPDMLWTITDIPFPLFNSVLHARLSDADAVIKAAVARYRRRNVPLLWWIGPSTQPSELSTTLEAFGFTDEEAIGMAADLHSLPQEVSVPPGFVIQRVEDIETMKIWCRVVCMGFEMPDSLGEPLLDLFSSIGFDSRSPLCHYIGSLNDEPVSASSMFLGAGVAGIYSVATIPKARKRGIGSAVTLKPLSEARTMGYRIGILHSSKIGVNVYHRLGFQDYCKIVQYVWRNRQASK
jgi:predicted GNAT family acetyltransferase